MAPIVQNIYDVIERYHHYINTTINFLKQAYKCDNLADCLKNGSIPRTGEIEGVSFNFHGIGCTASINDYIVSWDFGPDGRTDGFEAWKLWLFTRDHEEEFGKFAKLDSLRHELMKLKSDDQVYTMNDLGLTGNMFFLKKEGPRSPLT